MVRALFEGSPGRKSQKLSTFEKIGGKTWQNIHSQTKYLILNLTMNWIYLMVNLSQFTSHALYYVPEDQGPVVQSIVSLTSLLRSQLVKCFTTL